MKTYALLPVLALGFFAVACDSGVEPINDVPSESLTPAFAESQSTDLVTAGIIFSRPPSESKSLQPPDEDLLTRNGAQVLYRFQGFRGAVVRIPNQRDWKDCVRARVLPMSAWRVMISCLRLTSRGGSAWPHPTETTSVRQPYQPGAGPRPSSRGPGSIAPTPTLTAPAAGASPRTGRHGTKMVPLRMAMRRGSPRSSWRLRTESDGTGGRTTRPCGRAEFSATKSLPIATCPEQ